MSRAKSKHPTQPLYVDRYGIIRFKPNKIIKALVDSEKIDLNEIMIMQGVDQEDHRQLAQLIGYSASGFCDLSFVDHKTKVATDAAARKLWAKLPKKRGH